MASSYLPAVLSFHRRGVAAARVLALLALAATLLVAGVAALAWRHDSAADEAAVKAQLVALGALTSMDASRKRVSSLTLSTLKDQGNLDQALELAARLSRVESLDLSRLPVEDRHAELIAGFRSLKSLSLRETKITDETLAKLTRLSNLQALQLSRTGVTDQGLASVARVRSLSVVDLSDTVVGQLGVLRELPRLEWLTALRVKVTDGALGALAAAPMLKRLTLHGAEYSREDLESLQKQRPEVRIEVSDTE